MYLGELGPIDEVLKNPKHTYTKALVWATPNLDPDTEADTASPLRKIDVPDPRNPPSGWRFHTRCPKAREACTNATPESVPIEGDENHEYWNSPKLEDDPDDSTSELTELADEPVQ